jgi:hypothetical protein
MKAFSGRVYKPVANDLVMLPGGWGGGHDGSIDQLSLRFELGSAREPLVVEVSSKGSWDGLLSTALIQLHFELERTRRPRFPIVIERGRQRLRIDGRNRTFTTYTAGSAAVAVGTVDGVSVLIRCRKRRLPKLALERVELAELRDALRR